MLAAMPAQTLAATQPHRAPRTRVHQAPFRRHRQARSPDRTLADTPAVIPVVAAAQRQGQIRVVRAAILRVRRRQARRVVRARRLAITNTSPAPAPTDPLLDQRFTNKNGICGCRFYLPLYDAAPIKIRRNAP
jgi:hypothetical protein